MTNKFLSRSVASLTNDDTKILGNIKPKLKKLEEQYNLQTNKFKTLNSSWTPLVNKAANKTVFEERVDLASHWFDLWNDKQRKWFLLNLFSRLRPPQICYMEDLFESFGIYERRDFTRTLPTNLSKHIFSFLSPQDLARCAQVSSHWKHLSEHDDVWRPKALKFGWYLPYEPFHREHAAWKAHYIECVCGINALPLSKEDAYKYREVLYKRELTDVEKENFLYFQSKRDLQDWEKYEINCARKPWQHSSTKPRDLKKTDKLLYSYRNINNNQPTEENLLNSVYKTRFGLPIESKKPHLRELMKSRSITGFMLDDLRQSLPLHVLNIKDAYKSMRKSEADFFPTKLSSASMRSFKDYTNNLDTEKINTNSFGFSLSKNQTSFLNENPHVIFISSKVPCCHMLLEALKIDTIAIPYDFESVNIDSLSKLVQQALNGRLAKSIGFFLHFEKPGQVALTQDKSIYKVNITNNDISNFFMQIKNQACVEKNAKLDFFVPLGSCVDGIELVDKLQSFIGLDVRVPTGYLGNYKFVKSKWLNSGAESSNPSMEYFVEKKLDIWLNYCDVLNDAHDKINNTVMKGFSNEIDQVIVKRIVGKLVFDALSSTKFLSDTKIQQELSDLIIRSAKVKSENFFRILSTELTNDLIQAFQDDPLNENKTTTDSLESSGDDMLKSSLNLSSNNVMRSDVALRSFLRNRSVSEDLEPGLRIQISLEMAKSEISYLKQLEIIQKYYARPVKASLDAGRKIIAQSVIDLLFNDLAILYNLSKETVREFNLRIKNWKVDCCIADVLNTLSSNIQCYINYANNYDTIISTIDKLVNSNPKFRLFLLNANKAAGGLSLQSLLQFPWTRVKEYMNLLGSLQLHTPQNHPDHANIKKNITKIREVYLFIKQLQDRLNNKHEMIEIQRTILDSPRFITDGRYLILRQNATLLNKMTYAFVKDLACFLFNDGLLLAYRIKKHFPFTKFTEETLVYYELMNDLLNITISDISDYKHAVNVVNLQFNKYDDFFISFETYEAKHNFLKSLKLASELAVSIS